MTTTKTRKPWISGFCNPSHDRDSHTRCRMFTDTGTACACSCHRVPETEPLTWPGDNA